MNVIPHFAPLRSCMNAFMNAQCGTTINQRINTVNATVLYNTTLT